MSEMMYVVFRSVESAYGPGTEECFVTLFREREMAELLCGSNEDMYYEEVVVSTEVTPYTISQYEFTATPEGLTYTSKSITRYSYSSEGPDYRNTSRKGGVYNTFRNLPTVETPSLRGSEEYCNENLPGLLAHFANEVESDPLYRVATSAAEWTSLSESYDKGPLTANVFSHSLSRKPSQRIPIAEEVILDLADPCGIYHVDRIETSTRQSKKGKDVVEFTYIAKSADSGDEVTLTPGMYVRLLELPDTLTD